MEEYTDFNTKIRAKSKSDSEKDFYKLMNNIVFEKTMENVRNRIDIKLGDEELKQAKKPNFKNVSIFGEESIASQLYKQKVK